MKRSSGPHDQGQTCRRQWCFDCLVNSSPFSHVNTICLEFLYKQCTSSFPLFQRNTNKQKHEVDRMLKRFRATVPFFSQMVYHLTEEGHLLPETLVHCLYKKLQTCLPTSHRSGKPYLINTVCTYHFFFHLLHTIIEIYWTPSKAVKFLPHKP